ncbi:MAG: bifunctional methylenetetrahydrofolate dehydrogenase/methenyltetrahydrofolate cyclohydrolase [Gammaproteobacteria bacterium RIFCSPHIGHO2_12_FULL_45_9]|nr:MAG: bifunctional methylenetetrahydrofolate dehydrogenase/methenyltetrahydrofolate cyclohydrolase [Gammaproteobacteria bacterium RIFCSPHIGHO2_12_FULL_45_9]
MSDILDGKVCATYIKTQVAESIRKRTALGIVPPGLAVILVGDNPASCSYVNQKQKACEEVGIISELHHLPEGILLQELEERIDHLNNAQHIDGILLQLPLPETLMSHTLLERIRPEKDVDGFHPFNLGRLALRYPGLRPCTPFGVIQLLRYFDCELAGKHVVIVGASNIVGRPMALEFLLAKSTVTICHRFTRDLDDQVSRADILVSATGKPGLIHSDWIKPGAIVVDVGFMRDETGRIRGDLDFKTAAKRASWITPVPGGVGPMTVATLMQNTLKASLTGILPPLEEPEAIRVH